MPKGAMLVVATLLSLLALSAVPAGVRVALAQESQPERITSGADVEIKPAAPNAGGEAAKQQTPPEGEAKKEAPANPFNTWYLLAMFGGLILLYVWMGRGKKKEQRRRNEMLGNLKKGDKITTIGGIIGTVVEVRPDDVMVKTDESANVRMRFARWAIRGVGEAGKAETPEQAKSEEKK
jgi:preprotein translocase subunit YajC